jgi:Recombination endonuclease VII
VTKARVLGGCIDCPPGSRRPTTRPGPRCATHQRERKRKLAAKKHAEWILKTYGITAEDYWALYRAQGGRCYICQRAKGKDEYGNGRGKRLPVDHDHKTGKVRGLLCNPCNRDVLGHLRDSIEALERAVTYLKHPPADQVLTQHRS